MPRFILIYQIDSDHSSGIALTGTPAIVIVGVNKVDANAMSAKVINSRYELVRPLGHGASATVFEVSDRQHDGCRRALKLVWEGADEDLLRGEFSRLSRLDHEGLVKVHDLDRNSTTARLGGVEIHPGRLFLVLDLVPGKEPLGMLDGIPEGARDRWLRGVTRDLASALWHLHRHGLVHHDLKPDNMLVVSEKGGAQRATLIDLGLATRPGAGGDGARGTLAYMAPEALAGGGDHRVDLYGLGATLFHLAQGRPPFKGRGSHLIQQILRDQANIEQPWLSPEMAALITRLLRKEPLERPQSARRVLMELSRLSGDHEELVRLRAGKELLNPAFVGRIDEGRLLDQALEGVAGQVSPRVLWVTGTPGSGKSMLVEQALSRHRVLAAAGARQPCEIRSGSTEAALLPLLGDQGPLHASAEDLQLFLADALEELVESGRPLTLHLRLKEDDAVARGLLELLQAASDEAGAGQARGAALLVLAEADVPPPVPGSGSGPEVIAVQPMRPAETHDLVSSMLGQDPGEQLAQRLHLLSHGVPGLVVELTRLWHQGGEGALEGKGLQGLAPLVRRGRQLLAPAQRLVMDALAAWGAPANLEQLARISGLTEEEAAGAVETLAGSGVALEFSGGQASLPSRAHVLGWRSAAGPGSRSLYQAAFELLTEQAVGGNDHASLAQRRVDLMLEGRLPGAGDEATEAARALADAHQPGSAAELLERAASLDVLTEAGRELLAEILVQTGRYEDALALLRGVPGSELLRAQALQLMGAYAEAEELLEAQLQSTPPERDASRREVLALLGRLRLKRGDPAGAQQLVAREAAGLLKDLPPSLDPGAAGVLEVAGLAELYQGRGEQADHYFAAGTGSLHPDEDPRLLSRFLDLRGMVAFSSGRLRQATEHYRSALDLAERTGDRHGAVTWRVNLGSVQLERGRTGEALELLTRAIRDLERLAQTTGLASALCNLANLMLLLGELDQASRHITRAGEVARQAGSSQTEAYVLSLGGDLLRRQGRHAEAAASYQEAARAFEGVGALSEARLCTLYRAEALGAAGEQARAAALVQAVAPDEPDQGLLAQTRLRLSLPSGSPQAPKGDLQALARRCATLEEQGNRRELWRAAALLALALPAMSATQARPALAQSQKIWEEMMKDTPEVFHDSMSQDPDAVALAEIWPSLMAEEPPPPAPGPRSPRARDASPALAHPARRLLQINKRLNSEHRLPVLLDYIIDTVIELTEAERGFLLLAEADGTLSVKVARNMDQTALEARDRSPGAAMPISFSIAEQAARQGEPVITVDATEDGRFAEALSVSHLRLRSVLAVPLAVKGRTVGTIYIDHRLRQGVFGEGEVRLVQDLADQAAIAIENARLLAENRTRQEEIGRLNQQLQEQVDKQAEELDGVREELRSSRQALGTLQFDYRSIVGRSPRMLELFQLMDRVTETDLPLVIQGESGTGKELVARAIHFNGQRVDGPFVGENCGAIPETLLESVLFGHVRGAFTGADRDRRGLFEVASGGTLFLDEVGETSPAMQTKLLRVLQDGEVRRVGGHRTRSTDVRIIAASNKDLSRLVEKGHFREDLYYRLNVVRIPLPPLRERREDIPLLVEHFFAKHAPDSPRTIQAAALAALMGYAWPGNVRELENEVMRLSALAGEVISPDDLSLQVRGGVPLQLGDGDDLSIKPRVEHMEKDLIARALKRTNGNNTQAAKLLGLSRYGLLKKLKRYSFVKDE